MDYEFIQRYPDVTRDGLSHSEIPGSKPACGSPGLIATYYVLHRLLAPRHSPHALSSLITKLNPSDILRFRRTSSRQTQRIIVICPKIYLCVVVKEHRLSFPSKVFGPENFNASQNLHHSCPGPTLNFKLKTFNLELPKVVGLTGVEPVTLRLSSACSNQLSYRPA